MPCPALPRPDLSCRPGPTLPCSALPCPALPCPVQPSPHALHFPASSCPALALFALIFYSAHFLVLPSISLIYLGRCPDPRPVLALTLTLSLASGPDNCCSFNALLSPVYSSHALILPTCHAFTIFPLFPALHVLALACPPLACHALFCLYNVWFCPTLVLF